MKSELKWCLEEGGDLGACADRIPDVINSSDKERMWRRMFKKTATKLVGVL